MTPAEEAYLSKAEELAAAKVRWAQAFMLARSRGKDTTDRQAAAAADEMTGAQTTVLEAELEIAKRRLR